MVCLETTLVDIDHFHITVSWQHLTLDMQWSRLVFVLAEYSHTISKQNSSSIQICVSEFNLSLYGIEYENVNENVCCLSRNNFFYRSNINQKISKVVVLKTWIYFQTPHTFIESVLSYVRDANTNQKFIHITWCPLINHNHCKVINNHQSCKRPQSSRSSLGRGLGVGYWTTYHWVMV